MFNYSYNVSILKSANFLEIIYLLYDGDADCRLLCTLVIGPEAVSNIDRRRRRIASVGGI